MEPRLVLSAAMQVVRGKKVAVPVVEKTPTDGLSAYQLAQRAGFVGTEAQWLASLRGSAGDTRVKFVRRDLQSDPNGVAVVPLPVSGLAVTISPSTDGIVVKSRVLGANAQGQPIVTIAFRRLNTGLLGITLGNLASIGIFQTPVGVVTFDLFAAEPTA